MTDSKSKLLEAVGNGNLEAVKEMLKSFCLSSKARKNSKSDYLTRLDKYSLFVEAVTKRRIEIVKLFVSSGLNFANNQHFKTTSTTPLHIAIGNEDIEMFKLLLNHGANISAEDDDKRTPLCFAAKVDKIEFVKVILEPYRGRVSNWQFSKIINHESKYGTALDEAIRNDNKEIIKILLEDFMCDSQGLKVAITEGKIDIVDNYINYISTSRSRIDYEINCARILHPAILSGQIDIVEHLLNTHKIDINKRIYFQLPLNTAIKSSYESMVDYFLKRGAVYKVEDLLFTAILFRQAKLLKKFLAMGISEGNSINSINNHRMSLLSQAISNKFLDGVKILLDYGANINIIDDGKMTPLHWAVKRKSIEIVQILLDHGAFVNARKEGFQSSDDDVTPLHTAARNKDIEMVRLLFKNGATITIIEGTISPFDCAAKSDSQEIVELLLNKGVFHDNSRQRLMSSAIYFAISYGNLELAKFFLKQGVALRTSEANIVINKPVLYLAAKRGYLEIFKLLLAETLTQGGHVDDCDNKLMTALHCAVIDGFKGFPDTFEESKIPSYITQDHKDRKEMISILLANGADIDARDINGMTPLHLSVYNLNHYYNAAAAVFLIQQGANFNAETEEGLNLIQCIKIHGEVEDDDRDREDYWGYDEKIKLGKELIKEIVLRVIVENADLSQNLLQSIRSNEDLKKFYECCAKEARKLAKEKFDKSNVTFADIIRTKNVNRLAAYTRNQSIADYLKSGYYRLKFIIYGQTVQDHFAPAILRRDLLDHQNVKDFFNFLPGKNGATLPNLPATFTNEVFTYFSNEDLENVKKAARFVRV